MILVDTSAWIDFFHGNARSAGTVDRLLDANQVAICGPILTELVRGMRSEAERRRVMPLFLGCRMLSQPDRLWDDAGEVGFLLGRKGRRVKTLDLLIACYALAHRLPLLTVDSDFQTMVNAGIPLSLMKPGKD